MEKKTTPAAVLKKAEEIICLYGDNIVLIGQDGETNIYKFNFPEDSTTGYPIVYLHNMSNNSVEEVTGFDAVDIIGKYIIE